MHVCDPQRKSFEVRSHESAQEGRNGYCLREGERERLRRPPNGRLDSLLVKAQLVAKVSEILAERRYTQTKAAELLGIPQPKLSQILRGQFRGVSERKLMDCLARLGRDVAIVVRNAPRDRRPGKRGTVSVEFR